jgi:hypothetical protein
MNFWEFLWLLVIWTPLALLWGVALVDITRREDVGGGTKALWAVVIVLLPFVGPLIYLFTRSVGVAEEQRVEAARARPEPGAEPGDGDRAHQLTLLADLRDRGALTPEEFEAEKARLLGGRSPDAAGPAADSTASSSTDRAAEDDAAGRAAARPARDGPAPQAAPR